MPMHVMLCVVTACRNSFAVRVLAVMSFVVTAPPCAVAECLVVSGSNPLIWRYPGRWPCAFVGGVTA